MAITDAGPVLMHEGNGFRRGGTTTTPRKIKARRAPVRRLKAKRLVRKRTSQAAENNPNVSGYHTSSVDAPTGYQGLFGPK